MCIRKKTGLYLNKEWMLMDLIVNESQNSVKEETNLFRILDRGIDDMEAGHELPLDEAFQKVSELRDSRRRARA